MGCHEPHCGKCWRQRVYRARISMEGQVNKWPDESYSQLLTRSVRNSYDIAEAWSDLGKTIRSFQKRASKHEKHPWHQVDEWVAVWELKNIGNGWNLHEHMIVTSTLEELDYSGFQAAWKAAADDPAAHLDFVDLNSSLGGVAYATKYLTKGHCWGGLTSAQAVSISEFLKGKRFLRRKRGTAPKMPKAGGAMCCSPSNRGDCEVWNMWMTGPYVGGI